MSHSRNPNNHDYWRVSKPWYNNSTKPTANITPVSFSQSIFSLWQAAKQNFQFPTVSQQKIKEFTEAKNDFVSYQSHMDLSL